MAVFRRVLPPQRAFIILICLGAISLFALQRAPVTQVPTKAKTGIERDVIGEFDIDKEATGNTNALFTALIELDAPYLTTPNVLSEDVVLLKGQTLLVGKARKVYAKALLLEARGKLGGKEDNTLETKEPYENIQRPKGSMVPLGNKATGRYTLIDTTSERGAMTLQNGTVFFVVTDTKEDEGIFLPWSILICLSHSDVTSPVCLPKDLFPRLHKHQKINRIPGFYSTFGRSDSVCLLSHSISHLSSLRGLFPPCFLLPRHRSELAAASLVLPSDSTWLISSALDPSTPGELLKNSALIDRINKNDLGGSIMVRLPILGGPFEVQLYVLITSSQPLLAYVHSVGKVIWTSMGSKMEKYHLMTWTELLSWVLTHRGAHSLRALVHSTQTQLAKLCLLVDIILPHKFNHLRNQPNSYRCENCYQLFSVNLAFNSSLHATILSINDIPELIFDKKQPLPNLEALTVIKDTIQTVTYVQSCKDSVYMKLISLNESYVTEKNVCLIQIENVCLTKDDLSFLLQICRENGPLMLTNVNKNLSSNSIHNMISNFQYFPTHIYTNNKFSKIYPSSNGHLFNEVINELYESLSFNHSSVFQQSYFLLREKWRHNTKDFHKILTKLENLKGSEGKEMNIQDLPLNLTSSKGDCSNDLSTLPYLKSVTVDPIVSLTPPFTPTTSFYHIKLPYHIFTITLNTQALHCQAEARLGDKFGNVGAFVLPIGLGISNTTIAIVDVSHSEPWMIASYVFQFAREESPSSSSVEDLVPCALFQDCDLLFASSLPCGLMPVQDFYKTSNLSSNKPPILSTLSTASSLSTLLSLSTSSASKWEVFLWQRKRLPVCKRSSDTKGGWVVPCTSCSPNGSCDWGKALWAPLGCRIAPTSDILLRECLSGHKVMFLGDSTNRALFYSLVESVNGSLTKWQKSHDLFLLRGLNGGRTQAVFSYYPKFWLPSNLRLPIDAELELLFQSARNSGREPLILGDLQKRACHRVEGFK